MTIPNLTTDLVILAVLSVAVIYGLVLGHNKLKLFALSVYVGLVLAQVFGDPLHNLIKNQIGLSLNVAKLVVFILPQVLLEIGQRETSRRRPKGGMIMTLVLCVLTGCLVISAGISLFDTDSIKRTVEGSSLAAGIYGLRLWWIAGVPLAVIGENFIKTREH